MRKIFSSLLLVGLVFALASGTWAFWNNDQTISDSSGTVTNNITASSNTGYNSVKLGGGIVTGGSYTTVNIQNVVNSNALAGSLKGDQTISKSSGTVTNNISASSNTGNNSINNCWWCCNYCNNKIKTDESGTVINVTNVVNSNSKTTGNLGDQEIKNSWGTVTNNISASSNTGSNAIYLGGRIYTGISYTIVEIGNGINQNSVGQ